MLSPAGHVNDLTEVVRKLWGDKETMRRCMGQISNLVSARWALVVFLDAYVRWPDTLYIVCWFSASASACACGSTYRKKLTGAFPTTTSMDGISVDYAVSFAVLWRMLNERRRQIRPAAWLLPASCLRAFLSRSLSGNRLQTLKIPSLQAWTWSFLFCTTLRVCACVRVFVHIYIYIHSM